TSEGQQISGGEKAIQDCFLDLSHPIVLHYKRLTKYIRDPHYSELYRRERNA
ncbi:unnamed protein product, partial [Allacma fusca]